MNDRDISSASVFLNILATLGFILIAGTPPQTTAEILWVVAAACGVYGTALAAMAIKREWVRVLSAASIIILLIAMRGAL
jgi:hypothetical protein